MSVEYGSYATMYNKLAATLDKKQLELFKKILEAANSLGNQGYKL